MAAFRKKYRAKFRGNLGTCPSRNFSKISCRVSPYLCLSLCLPVCFRVPVSIYFVISVFLCLSLCISVYPNLFLFGVCASLSLSVCLCLSVSRVVSVCLCLSLFVFMCPCLSFVSISLRLFVFLCLFPCVRACLFGNVCLYLSLSLSLSLSFCLSALGSADQFTKIAHFRVAACRISPLLISIFFHSLCLSFRF